jgi:pimeloyl-ACP methyl ester carboxylesterase
MKRVSTSQYLRIRHLRYHLRIWNPGGNKLLVALHGIRDGSATFQFLVDELPDDWCIVAPDWRGHGRSDWCEEEYFFQQYLSDLDSILNELSPSAPVRVLGHSMGGHVGCIYAGVKPDRVSHLISLDGFGLTDEPPETYPGRLRTWLARRAALKAHSSYPDIASMVKPLMTGNHRLTEQKALFLAEELSTLLADGSRRWAFDPQHRIPHPYLFRIAEWGACFEQVTAPVLWVGSDRPPSAGLANGGLQERLRRFKNARYVHIPDTGHNLHHDAPESVARLVIPFLG